MKIVKVAKRPRQYVERLYASHPAAASLSYQQQMAWFCADFFGPVDIWQTYLRPAGFEATDLILVPPLDAAWWAEHGAGSAPEAAELAAIRVARERPEVLVLEAIESFSPAEVGRIRRAASSIRGVIGVTGTDIRSSPTLREVDAILTCMPDFAAELRQQGRRAWHFPHSFDPRILAHLDNPRRIETEVTFLGNVTPGSHLHDYRRQVLEALARKFPLSVHSDLERSAFRAWKRYAQMTGARVAGKLAAGLRLPVERLPGGARLKTAAAWKEAPRVGFSSILASRAQPSVYGISMFRLLRRGRATVNTHVGLAGPHAANMRLFEATGAGTCLLTDRKQDLSSHFADDEVAAFGSVGEAVERVRWILDYPREADAMAAKGQARTLADHSFARRIPTIELACKSVLAMAPRQ